MTGRSSRFAWFVRRYKRVVEILESPSHSCMVSPISHPFACNIPCLAIDGNGRPDARRGEKPPVLLLDLYNPWVCRPRALGSMALAFTSAAGS